MFKFILNAILPRHVKRMLFCASVYAYIATKYHITPDQRRLSQMNDDLHLANRATSLICPCEWSKAVWHSLPTPPLDEIKVQRYIDIVIANTPSYLHYGRPEDIAIDLEWILSYIFTDDDFTYDVKLKLGSTTETATV